VCTHERLGKKEEEEMAAVREAPANKVVPSGPCGGRSPPVVLIAAAAPVRGTDTGILALDGKIPWDDAGDREWFFSNTWEGVCIMGRKTWEAMPKLRMGRHFAHVIIVSSHPIEGKHVAATPLIALDEARVFASSYWCDSKIVVCGGEDVYAALWPHVDIALVTHIANFPPYTADDIHALGDRVRTISMTPPNPCGCGGDHPGGCHGMRDSDFHTLDSGSYVVIHSKCVDDDDDDDDDDE
jgi:dihydrofolate reductase